MNGDCPLFHHPIEAQSQHGMAPAASPGSEPVNESASDASIESDTEAEAEAKADEETGDEEEHEQEQEEPEQEEEGEVDEDQDEGLANLPNVTQHRFSSFWEIAAKKYDLAKIPVVNGLVDPRSTTWLYPAVVGQRTQQLRPARCLTLISESDSFAKRLWRLHG